MFRVNNLNMHAIVNSVEKKTSKNGKPYTVFALQSLLSEAEDISSRVSVAVNTISTCTFQAYFWKSLTDDYLQSLRGSVITFKYQQKDFVTIESFSIVPDEKVSPELLGLKIALIPSLPSEESWNSLIDSIVSQNKITTTIPCVQKFQEYLSTVFLPKLSKNLYSRYSKAVAAKKNHHNYPGGLLVHTYQILDCLDEVYPAFNRITPTNIIYSAIGILFHDFGKLEEYTPSGDYTYQLYLLGHPYLGARMLQNILTDTYVRSTNFEGDEEQLILLEIAKIVHCVLAHHGIAQHKDWGSPVLPQSPEAFLVSCLDYMSGMGDQFNHPINPVFPAL